MSQQNRLFGVIETYRDRLPMDGIDQIVTLGEGATPLVPAPRLGAELDATVWVKVEGANPTGSFKDRGMTMAMTKALADGSKAVVCASTGNTSASASAYASRAGMTPVVLLPQTRPGCCPWRSNHPDSRQLRRLPAYCPRAGREFPGLPGELDQSVPHRGTENCCL